MQTTTKKIDRHDQHLDTLFGIQAGKRSIQRQEEEKNYRHINHRKKIQMSTGERKERKYNFYRVHTADLISFESIEITLST